MCELVHCLNETRFYFSPNAAILSWFHHSNYHSQQVALNLLLRHCLDAVLPSRGIKPIAYVNTNNRAESLTFTSSFSCFSGNVHSTYRKKLCTMYFTQSGLSSPGVFLLVINLLVTIWKARPHGSFSTSPIKPFQHWSRLFFMPCLRAVLAVSHASCSRVSPFERVCFRRAVRRSQRRTATGRSSSS